MAATLWTFRGSLDFAGRKLGLGGTRSAIPCLIPISSSSAATLRLTRRLLAPSETGLVRLARVESLFDFQVGQFLFAISTSDMKHGSRTQLDGRTGHDGLEEAYVNGF
jgi:hypothetical protein